MHPLACHRHKGFTLLEIVVVLAIIAILTGVAVSVLNFDSREQYINDAAQKIVQLYRATRDEAVLSGSPRRLVKQAENRIIGEKKQALGDPTYILMEDMPIVNLSEKEMSIKLEPKGPIYLFPSGQTTPFQLILSLKGDNYVISRQITGDAMGRLEIKTP